MTTNKDLERLAAQLTESLIRDTVRALNELSIEDAVRAITMAYATRADGLEFRAVLQKEFCDDS